MKLARTSNTVRNFAWGILYQMINIILPFIGRTAFIHILGEDYLGLNSLFGSILSILNMSELGISAAIVYNMYDAIARDDEHEICALMNFYKKCYRAIGIFVFFVGSAITPGLTYIIKGELPHGVNLYILYGINLFSVGISYFMYAYKHSIFWAFQRGDLDKKVVIPLDISKYIVQIVVLFIFRNYYAYIIVVPIFNIITNLARGWVVDRYYPQYKAKGDIGKEATSKIAKNVKALFLNKIGGTLSNSLDSIVISMFIGLAILGKYNNYTYITGSVISFIQLFFDGLCAGWGNSLKTETIERNWEIFKELTFINNWMICFCSACLICLFQPFITMWIGEAYLLPIENVILIVVFFWINRYRYVMFTCKDAAGLWRIDQYRPLVVGIVNVILNVILVSRIGLIGIILATILSTVCVGYPWVIYNVFTGLFKRSPREYILSTIKSFVFAVFICVVTYWMCSFVKNVGMGSFVLKLLICCIVPNLLFIVIHIRDKELKTSIKRIVGLLKRKA